VSAPLAITRGDIYDYVAALFLVYIAMIFIRIILSWVPRMPYNPHLRAVVGFIEECVDPYLNLFRAVLKPLGFGGMAIDLSPMLGILVLFVVRNIVLQAIINP
jgi:YggT family protein